MDESLARNRAEKIVGNYTDGPLPEDVTELLVSDDGVMHLAAAYQELEHADASGIKLDSIPYSDVEQALRSRCYGLITANMETANNQRRWENIAAKLQPSTEQQ